MKSTKASRNTRRIQLALLIGALTVVATAISGGPSLQGKPKRTSTDPPTFSQGKFGQDLFLAIDHHDLAGVKALIQKGADPNARNGLEFTPLFIAAASHQTEVMKVLLQAGAKADAESTYGTALTFSALTGNVDGFYLLLSKGVKPDTHRGDGMTVLMAASNTGVPPIVAELIKRKVDVSANDIEGETALSLAARNGHTEIGRMLLAAGAKVNTANRAGATPLMLAAQNGHVEIAKLLMQGGATVNSRDQAGRTALILSAQYGDHAEVVKVLIAGGAQVRASDKAGKSAADYASMRTHKASAASLGTPNSATKALTPEAAVRLSLKLIQSSTKRFEEMAACISCHHEGLGRITTASAAARAFALDPAVQRVQAGRMGGFLAETRQPHLMALKTPEVMKQLPLIEMNEISSAYTWILAGMAANNQVPNEATAAMALVLARQQSADGNWSFSLPRVPMQSSFFTFTALAIRGLQAYGPRANASEITERIGRARGWLSKAPAQSSEDRASRLLGLKWSGADVAAIQKAAGEVQSDQRTDGGWAQLPNLQSDAYATGQALYALHVGGGLPVTDSAYQAGVAYLLSHQDADGSWFVNKRAIPANNYFDAGFPHSGSQYSSFNGTCWATLALLETIPRSAKP